MAETTIAWTGRALPDGGVLPGYTWNPWIGCLAVSPACDRCYAAALVHRWGGDFGVRRRTSAENWKLPFRWDRLAAAAGVQPFVFTLSMGDFFDNAVPEQWRADAWAVIRATPHLTYLVLTKRPQNILKPGYLPTDWGDGYPNVWIGATAENATELARRVPHLVQVPAVRRFLSCEPLLSALNLRPWLGPVSWVIAGGESGGGARSTPPALVRDLRDQCAEVGVAFFHKQTGSNREAWGPGVTGKGDRPEQWPADLRVQEHPHA